ncbi:hypothetical protein AB0I69_07240 [Streptomyces sp. NPDC050508]|uniref:hypothetical protein n=1 Tax=Streptomyces sp. NPDC050508 TaxID=3155405 RepID=UPI00344A0FB6
MTDARHTTDTTDMTQAEDTGHWIHRPLPHHDEVNVVFFRGMSLDALTRELLAVQRIPLAYAKDTGWGLVMHDMFGWNSDDYDLTHYGQVCRGGGELVVIVTEPCLAKAHGPAFEYYRDGRLVSGFSFETPYYGVGDEPDLLASALTAARLIGPHAELDRDDQEERIARVISDFFALPDLELP